MTLDEIFDQVEKLDNVAYNDYLNEKLNAVLPKLNGITLNSGDTKISGKTLLSYIFTATIVTDYNLNDYEVNFLCNIIRRYINPNYDYAATRELILSAGKSIEGYKNFADAIVDTFGNIDSQLKIDVVTLCMMVAAVDGKITQSERNFLAKLLA